MTLRTYPATACGSVLIAATTLWLCLPCYARTVAQQEQAKAAALPILLIDLGDEAGGYGYEPLQALSSAIDRHPGNRLIQITWILESGSLSASMTGVYDRRHSTIKYYCDGGHNAGGNPAERVYAHYLYTGATAALIHEAAEYEKNRDCGTKSRYGQGPFPDAVKKAPTFHTAGTAGSYYDSLLLFGCRRIKLP